MRNPRTCCSGVSRFSLSLVLTLAVASTATLNSACDGFTTESDMPEPGGTDVYLVDEDGDSFVWAPEGLLHDLALAAQGLRRDCDDVRAGVNPDATEVCNGLDDNCDGEVDEGLDCAECHVNEDCPATDFCADGGTCETVPCAAEGECVIARVVDHVCVIEPVVLTWRGGVLPVPSVGAERA